MLRPDSKTGITSANTAQEHERNADCRNEHWLPGTAPAPGPWAAWSSERRVEPHWAQAERERGAARSSSATQHWRFPDERSPHTDPEATSSLRHSIIHTGHNTSQSSSIPPKWCHFLEDDAKKDLAQVQETSQRRKVILRTRIVYSKIIFCALFQEIMHTKQ